MKNDRNRDARHPLMEMRQYRKFDRACAQAVLARALAHDLTQRFQKVGYQKAKKDTVIDLAVVGERDVVILPGEILDRGQTIPVLRIIDQNDLRLAIDQPAAEMDPHAMFALKAFASLAKISGPRRGFKLDAG